MFELIVVVKFVLLGFDRFKLLVVTEVVKLLVAAVMLPDADKFVRLTVVGKPNVNIPAEFT